MSYHEVFYQTMDDAEELCKWEKAHEAAERAAQSKLDKQRSRI